MSYENVVAYVLRTRKAVSVRYIQHQQDDKVRIQLKISAAGHAKGVALMSTWDRSNKLITVEPDLLNVNVNVPTSSPTLVRTNLASVRAQVADPGTPTGSPTPPGRAGALGHKPRAADLR